ncbi:hypothetical protein DSCW_66040 [Desulfosarcina widdelii]|uniref:Uncharacterized protein n=1 Tax=Desulfosarcina widdelii TaxID=947919 RepID=A0A5K7ZQ96_9BACT|nr:hypothetical protein [Desulfosarcina widdelii]BBO79187.1 hypothetical protein DSCW_66040 [Desulfosarcina widdelii]
MAKTENRWQLLLVADDGRIVPFKRIKGIALTLAVLLVILGLLCAGLGWQWTAEKVRHRKTKDLLADANRQLNHYKSEVELITAELVLAEVRMEEAGLPVTKRRERVSWQSSMKQPDTTASDEEAEKSPEEKTTPEAAPARESEKETSTPPGETAKPAETDFSSAASTAEKEKEKPAAVALGELTINHDTQKKILMARFRVNNNAPGSSKVAGKCVVVLKNDNLEPDSWLALPKVTLVDGVPDGENGRAFRISRFIDMELMAPAETDPSVFDTARVYVFDSSEDPIIEKDYPITLPPSVSAAKGESVKPSVDQPAEEAVAAAPKKAAVAVADLVLTHDAANKTLMARFRVKNAGKYSAPVAGRCVVVLKTGQEDQDSWLTMPRVTVVDGQPEGNRGQAFRISRFKDMEIKARGVADPSMYESATVYVFDTSGNALLEETIPVSLPAPPADRAAPTPATDSQEKPAEDTVTPESADKPETTGKAPDSDTAAPDPPAAAPVEDPSLTDGAAPSAREDSRSRF